MLPSFPVLLLHVVGATGFVIVVSMGLVTKPIRDLWVRLFEHFPTWSKMLACPMCFGVWGGAAWGALLLWRPILPGVLVFVHDVLAFAFTVSLVGFLIALFDHAVGGLGAIKDAGNPKPSLLRRRSGRI
jgi:hypothetical protein